VVLDVRKDNEEFICLVDHWDAAGSELLRVSWGAERVDDPIYRPVAGGVVYIAAPPGADGPAQYTARPRRMSDPLVLCWTEGGLMIGDQCAVITLLPEGFGFERMVEGPEPYEAKVFHGRMALLWPFVVEGRVRLCWRIVQASANELRDIEIQVNDIPMPAGLPVSIVDHGDIPAYQRPMWAAVDSTPLPKIPEEAAETGDWSLRPGHATGRSAAGPTPRG
jgi:hypothetical protein